MIVKIAKKSVDSLKPLQKYNRRFMMQAILI